MAKRRTILPSGERQPGSYDGVEIDFVIQYEHLTDAGYNAPTYDTRILTTAAQ